MSRIYAVIILGFVIPAVRGFCLDINPDSSIPCEIEISVFRDLDGEIIVPPIGDGELDLDGDPPAIDPEESTQPDQGPEVSAQSVEQFSDTGGQESLEPDFVDPSLMESVFTSPSPESISVGLKDSVSADSLQGPEISTQSVEQFLNPDNQPSLGDNCVELVDNSQAIINKTKVNPEGISLSQFQAPPPAEDTNRGISSTQVAIVDTPAKSVSPSQSSPGRIQSVNEPSTITHPRSLEIVPTSVRVFSENHLNGNSHSPKCVERTSVTLSVTPVRVQTPVLTTSDSINPVVNSTIPVSEERHRIPIDVVTLKNRRLQQANNVKDVITRVTDSLQALPPGEIREMVVNSLVAQWVAAIGKRREGEISCEQREERFDMRQDFSIINLKEIYYTTRMSNKLVDYAEIFINLKSAGSFRKGLPISSPYVWNFYTPRDVVKELLKKLRRSESITDTKIKLVIPDARSFMNRVFILLFAVLIFCVTLGYVLGRSYVVLKRSPLSYQVQESL